MADIGSKIEVPFNILNHLTSISLLKPKASFRENLKKRFKENTGPNNRFRDII